MFDCAEAVDGSLQFTFERAIVVDVFDEVSGAEAGFVEQFESDTS